MHLRFDGKLGYPGGIIDPGETIIEGVQREILEETNLKMKLTPDDFVASMEEEYKAIRHGKEYEKIKLYFFSKEIDEENFLKFEDESRQAKHFGIEILGHIRAPLYRFRQTEGLPRFLTNSFAGTAKVQLLLAICKTICLPSMRSFLLTKPIIIRLVIVFISRLVSTREFPEFSTILNFSFLVSISRLVSFLEISEKMDVFGMKM